MQETIATIWDLPWWRNQVTWSARKTSMAETKTAKKPTTTSSDALATSSRDHSSCRNAVSSASRLIHRCDLPGHCWNLRKSLVKCMGCDHSESCVYLPRRFHFVQQRRRVRKAALNGLGGPRRGRTVELAGGSARCAFLDLSFVYGLTSNLHLHGKQSPRLAMCGAHW